MAPSIINFTHYFGTCHDKLRNSETKMMSHIQITTGIKNCLSKAQSVVTLLGFNPLYQIIPLGVPRTSKRAYISSFKNRNSDMHSSSCILSKSKFGCYQYGILRFLELLRLQRRTNSSSFNSPSP